MTVNPATKIATADASLAKLRSAAAEGSPLAKVVDLIESLGARLTKLEASTALAEKTAPLPFRKG